MFKEKNIQDFAILTSQLVKISVNWVKRLNTYIEHFNFKIWFWQIKCEALCYGGRNLRTKAKYHKCCGFSCRSPLPPRPDPGFCASSPFLLSLPRWPPSSTLPFPPSLPGPVSTLPLPSSPLPLPSSPLPLPSSPLPLPSSTPPLPLVFRCWLCDFPLRIIQHYYLLIREHYQI